MNQDKIKRALCEAHADLLHIILYFGGFMLLAQLRALCLVFGLYASGQAVNRAVRELRKADILNRQTWVDNNSDLLLARKYAYRFFGDATSQEVATPRRPSTMAPYIIQARKIDWLLDIVQRKGLTSLDAVHRYLTHCGCTVFLRLPDLPGYYVDHYDIFTESGPEEFWEQADRLEVVTSWRASIARAEPVQKGEADPPVTLELAHRRGVYIERIFPEKKAVRLALFAGLSTRPQRIMDWVIDAHMWLKTLMPQYRSIFAVYALSDTYKAALRAGLTGTAYNRQTPYFRAREDSTLNRQFEDFAGFYGFKPILCRPYRGQTKGKVERTVQFVRDTFMVGIKYNSLADLNGQALAWCNKVNGKVHATTPTPAISTPCQRSMSAKMWKS